MKTWLRIGVLAAYVIAPLAQVLHLAHEAEHVVCASCSAEEHGHSVRCAGGCGGGDHHHHAPAHRHSDCAICKASFSGIVMVESTAPGSSDDAVMVDARSDSAPRADVPARAHRPRSPPVLG